MTINISEQITTDTLNKFITFFNENKNVEKIIYFSTNGGDTDVTNAIVDLMNNNKETTTLIAYSKLYSAGFELFFKVKCEKIILRDTLGMYHQGRINLDVNENIKPIYYEDETRLNYHKSCKKETVQFGLYLGFTTKQIRLLNKGDDVWFLNQQLQEFLKHSDSLNVLNKKLNFK